MPVEMATLVTMLGSGINAGSVAADAMCTAKETKSVEIMSGNIVEDASLNKFDVGFRKCAGGCNEFGK
jgi:hypothetical protein